MPDVMHDSFDSLGEFGELEALVRRAKDYVRPSDDLRPRVLEAARRERSDRRMQGYLRWAAVVVLVLGVLAAALRQRPEAAGIRHGVLAAITRCELFVPAEGALGVDVNWNLVDSFTELRRRQAELLRPAPEFRRPKA